jgi:hypothetical protein
MLVMAPETDRHLSDEIIESYSLGGLSEEDLARTEEHLLICEHCRRRTEESDEWVAAMAAAARRIDRQPIGRSWFTFFPRLVPVLAGLILATVIGIVGMRPGANPAATIMLTATRGPRVEIKAPARTSLTLRPDLTSLPPEKAYKMEVVDSEGASVWLGTYPGAAVKGLAPGLYFVRVSSPRGELYREYGLQVEAGR